VIANHHQAFICIFPRPPYDSACYSTITLGCAFCCHCSHPIRLSRYLTFYITFSSTPANSITLPEPRHFISTPHHRSLSLAALLLLHSHPASSRPFWLASGFGRLVFLEQYLKSRTFRTHWLQGLNLVCNHSLPGSSDKDTAACSKTISLPCTTSYTVVVLGQD